MYVCLFEVIRMSVFFVCLVDRSIVNGKVIEIDQTMMRESTNVRTGVTDASVPNTVVHDFCEKENKYRAITLAVETAESVELGHREGITVTHVRIREKDREKDDESL